MTLKSVGLCWKETDVATVELRNENCHNGLKSNTWIETWYRQWRKTDNNLAGWAGHWDLHLPDQVSYLPQAVLIVIPCLCIRVYRNQTVWVRTKKRWLHVPSSVVQLFGPQSSVSNRISHWLINICVNNKNETNLLHWNQREGERWKKGETCRHAIGKKITCPVRLLHHGNRLPNCQVYLLWAVGLCVMLSPEF